MQLCRKFRVKDLKNRVFKAKSANQIDIEAVVKKISKSVARETERSRFSSVAITANDIPGGDLVCHCLTTMDDLSGVAITNTAYGALFAKKLLNQILLDFRDFFSFNPSMYIDMREDNPDYDTSLEPGSLDETFELWQNPTVADQEYQLEQQLHQIKDVMLDNLQRIVERGEQLD